MASNPKKPRQMSIKDMFQRKSSECCPTTSAVSQDEEVCQNPLEPRNQMTPVLCPEHKSSVSDIKNTDIPLSSLSSVNVECSRTSNTITNDPVDFSDMIASGFVSDSLKLDMLSVNTSSPGSSQYPTTSGRRYQKSWEENRPWLKYSNKTNAAFCSVCLCFSSHRESPFVKGGFSDWKKAAGIKINKLDKHAESDAHRAAAEKALNFMYTNKHQGSDIGAKLDQEHASHQIRTEKGILSIIDIIIALGQRGIPFRGNWMKNEKTEDGNFSFFLEWKSNFDPDLSEHLKYAKANARYTSPQIQNEIISLCEAEIRERILKCIPKFWSIMADETQDASTTEQVSLCARYVNQNCEIREDFLGFVSVKKMDAQSIADAILGAASAWGLDMNNLVGQGYDGAAVMSSSVNGVQGKIAAVYPNAVYVHCRSHVLNLALSSGCKSVPTIRNVFDNVTKVTWFLSGSAKRKAIYLEADEEDHDSQLLNTLTGTGDDETEPDMEASATELRKGSKRKAIPKFCATRWTARVSTLSALIAKYQTVLQSLEQIAISSSGDARSDANSYVRMMADPQFIVALVVAQFVLSFCSSVTLSLQAESCDLGTAYRDVALSRDCIANARTDEVWSRVWNRIVSIGQSIDVDITKPRTCGVQRHRANATAPQQIPSDYYRVNVYNSFIDHVISELDTRFDQSHKAIIAAQNLIPCYHSRLDENCINSIMAYYGKFLSFAHSSGFEAEAEKWKRYFTQRPEDERPNTATECLDQCTKSMFPAIHTILTIFMTTPVGSVACERSFSTLRRLKLWTRASMSDDRLTGLAMLNSYRGTAYIPSPSAVYARKKDWRKVKTC